MILKCNASFILAIESQSIVITNPSVDINGVSPSSPINNPVANETEKVLEQKDNLGDEKECEETKCSEETEEVLQVQNDTHSCCISPASSSGGVYSVSIYFSLYIYSVKLVKHCLL